MVELGQLEKQHAEFVSKGIRIVAVSLDDIAETKQTQESFPHLTILSDHDQSLARAADVIGPHYSPTGEIAVSPTTVVLDKAGDVRWVYRPGSYTSRLSPQDLLTEIDGLKLTR
jgi:peroxiredoxin